MAKSTMTFDEALNILQGDVTKCNSDILERAINVVRDQEPNHPALRAAQEALDSAKSTLSMDDALVYSANINDMDIRLSSYNYDSFINNSDNSDIKSYVDIVDIVESDGKKTKPVSESKKKEYVELLFEAAKLKAQTSLAGSKLYLEKSPAEKNRMLEEEIKNTFFTDFARAAISSHIKTPTKKEEKIGSKSYKQYILKQVQNAADAFKKLIQRDGRISVKVDSILASCADSASQVESYIKSIKQRAKDAGKEISSAFNKIATGFQKKKNQIEKFANKISENRYEIFKAIKGSFKDNKIKIIGNISASAAFGVVTAGIAAGTIGAPLTLAVGAYAAYHAAGSWVYPIVAEMRKINRVRREKGQPVLGFKAQLVQAWKNKTSKDKNKNSYKARNTYIVQGVINTGLAAIGFGCLKNGLEAIDNVRTLTEGVTDGLEATQAAGGINIDIANSIAQTKHAVSMGRIAIPLAGQFADAAVTYGISLADPNDKTKAEEAKQTAVAALVGAGFSALAQGITFAVGSNGADITQDITQNTSDTAQVATETAETAIISGGTTNEASVGFFGKVKDWFSYNHKGSNELQDVLPQQNENNAPVSGEELSTVSDTLFTNDSVEVTDTLINEQNMPEDQTLLPQNEGDANSDVAAFPDSYNQEMGISEKQYNVLVKTTEGTLKSATGNEVTLDTAYANLSDETMANFPNQTREEVLYKFNRLYAFMRKAYEVGDGTLRETPSGAAYLESKFDAMNLNLSDEQMDSLVSFAQDNTYASSAEIRNGLKEMFSDNLDAKTTSALVTTIHSNQRFYQNAQEMEALVNLLGCGKELSAQDAVKVNALLERTDEILKTGKVNTVLTGLNLGKGCADDDGEWRRVAAEVKVPAAAEEVKIPVIEFDDDIEIIDEEIVIEDPVIELDDKPIMLAKLPLQQPIQEEPAEEIVVAKSVSTNVHGISDPEYADKTQNLEGARAKRWIRKASRD